MGIGKIVKVEYYDNGDSYKTYHDETSWFHIVGHIPSATSYVDLMNNPDYRKYNHNFFIVEYIRFNDIDENDRYIEFKYKIDEYFSRDW